MKRALWKIIAWIVSRAVVREALIRRAKRTPYFHIMSPDGSDVYMARYWLFNPYNPTNEKDGQHTAKYSWLPSIRLHHIMRADNDRHLHDHPFDARTMVMHRWYQEETPQFGSATRVSRLRMQGYTGEINYGQFHRISEVAQGGVWTMFWIFRHYGGWGFDVDGTKVQARDYFASGYKR